MSMIPPPRFEGWSARDRDDAQKYGLCPVCAGPLRHFHDVTDEDGRKHHKMGVRCDERCRMMIETPDERK